MASFSEAELAYLLGERRLGRLATVDADGTPHVVPVGWRYDHEEGTIDVSGRNLPATKKFRNAKANPRAALVVDDVLPPWRPRSVMVRGEARAMEEAADGGEIIRILPGEIISWGLEEAPSR